MTKPKILVVGSVNMDLVLPLDRMPDAGETLFGETYSYVPGGKGANQAVAAARMGAEVTFCGRVGRDAFGKTLTDNLRREGIDTSFIVEDNAPTGLAVIPVEKSGQNRIIVISGANMKLTEADVKAAFTRDYNAVMMQLEAPLPVVYATYQMARDRGIPVILDAGPAMKIPLEPLYGIDILSPNETEIYAMTGLRADSPEGAAVAAKRLAALSGAKAVVVKMGKQGALLHQNGAPEFFPAFDNITVADTTAAGDTFTAALAVQWLLHGDLDAAVRYANAAGALCVSRKGAQPSIPTAAETAEFLK